MLTVRLNIATGEKVADVKLPPFKTLPDVIIWGTRVFSKTDELKTWGAVGAESPESLEPCATYTEGFCYVVPPNTSLVAPAPSPGLDAALDKAKARYEPGEGAGEG